ncbi:MAG: HAMP domain-containing protein [Bacteroidetes bacterium]|nr:MAG: HAMP domain-containing protein [Bacteroidota bacterium]
MNIIRYIRDFFRNLRLFYKFQIALFFVSTITLSVMGYFGYTEGKDLLKEKSFNMLRIMAENKRKTIETYFQTLKNQITTVSENPSTLEALKAFQAGMLSHQPIGEAEKKVLERYYSQQVLDMLIYNSLQKEWPENYVPTKPQAQALQYKYIANNPKPFNFRHLLEISADAPQAYDEAHKQFHRSFLTNKTAFELADILLIDKKGNVVYSVAKNIDFGQNLLTSPLRHNGAGALFQRLLQSHEENSVLFRDYEHYIPNQYIPSCFIGTSIYVENQELVSRREKIGAIIFQISNEKITSILTNNQDWAGEGLGVSGEIALVGPEFKLRNNTRRFLEDPVFYQNALLNSERDTVAVERIKRQKTTILHRKYQNQATMDAVNGKSGQKLNTDFLGSEVLDVFMPIDILGVRWAMIAEMDGTEVFSSAEVFRVNLLAISGILFVLVTLLGAYLAQSLANPMRKIQREIAMLSEGVFPKISSRVYHDELGKIDASLNVLISNMRDVAKFAEDIGKGNFDSPFQARNDKDVLSNSLVKMRDSLKQLAIEEGARSWVNTGTAMFSNILRESSDDLQHLAIASVTALVKYLEANQGVFFYYQEDKKCLEAIGTYAYDKEKYWKKTILVGEGIAGQVFLEGSTVYLTEVPESYSKITSGLGYARPRSVLVVPVKSNERIYGVIEIASLEILDKLRVKFAEDMCENIAVTISRIRTAEETQKLLEESQRATEQLRQQEEEMRQNFEELMATQEEMRLRQEKLDILLHGQVQSQNNERILQSLDVDERGHTPEDRIREAIERQKALLDKTYQQNREKEQKIRDKITN